MASLHAEQEKLTLSINTWGHLWSAQNRISSDCIKYHFFTFKLAKPQSLNTQKISFYSLFKHVFQAVIMLL